MDDDFISRVKKVARQISDREDREWDVPFSIENCARCGGDHEDLTARDFKNKPNYAGVEHRAYAICPATKDPILIREVD